GPFTGLGGNRRIQSFSLSLAQLLSPLSLVSVTINPIRSDGYLGHPYNPVITATGALIEERLPNRKTSLAVSGKLVQGWQAGDRLGSVHLEARHYRDDWRLISNTVDVQAYQYLSDATWIRLRARGYRQGQAAFVQGAYLGNETYRTSDIRFSSFYSLMLGVKVASSFPDAWAESGWLPDRWDIGYDHGFRNTRGESGRVEPVYRYQLFSPDQIYQQGTVMAGLGFDL
ncbi:MAG TPA: DUF3570 domain-containing protein, partial [Fibrobacteria bacterium]|nr:DUF3570 domain-containing protein [Fibrobacteria bacterium]